MNNDYNKSLTAVSYGMRLLFSDRFYYSDSVIESVETNVQNGCSSVWQDANCRIISNDLLEWFATYGAGLYFSLIENRKFTASVFAVIRDCVEMSASMPYFRERYIYDDYGNFQYELRKSSLCDGDVSYIDFEHFNPAVYDTMLDIVLNVIKDLRYVGDKMDYDILYMSKTQKFQIAYIMSNFLFFILLLMHDDDFYEQITGECNHANDIIAASKGCFYGL